MQWHTMIHHSRGAVTRCGIICDPPLMMSEGGPAPSQAPLHRRRREVLHARAPASESHWGDWGGLGGHWEALGCTGKQ